MAEGQRAVYGLERLERLIDTSLNQSTGLEQLAREGGLTHSKILRPLASIGDSGRTIGGNQRNVGCLSFYLDKLICCSDLELENRMQFLRVQVLTQSCRLQRSCYNKFCVVCICA